jgi:hypothetical protein
MAIMFERDTRKSDLGHPHLPLLVPLHFFKMMELTPPVMVMPTSTQNSSPPATD